VLPLRINRKCISAVDLHAALPGLHESTIDKVLKPLADCNRRFANWCDLQEFFMTCGARGATNSKFADNFVYT
jgi:hypothetical protein